jgi:L-ascorbate metabolism protein UlaG (beta-lactamase superfamily)
VPPESLSFDVVLLSHDHHADNLDCLGRDTLRRAQTVFTTEAGAERLGGNAQGLKTWASVELPAADGGLLKVTAVPARHGPEGGDRGPVIGFVLERGSEVGAVYLSGDTVWYDGLNEIRERFHIDRAILFMGAARVPEVGPSHLTMSAADGIQFARAFRAPVIVPLHYEGWQHFSESRQDIAAAFAKAGLDHRLRWLRPGLPEIV